jgi:1,4-alpha-glucan branching enzyme
LSISGIGIKIAKVYVNGVRHRWMIPFIQSNAMKKRALTMKKKQNKTNRRRIIFSTHAPEAKNVSLVGEFNNWNPEKHPMKSEGNGQWIKTVMLNPGTYEYKFLVDENWLLDTKNDHSRLNCYGTLNSVITVSPWQK